MLNESTFRISNIDTSITTRDSVRCLTGLFDDAGRSVTFEIVWIDDTTFLTAASCRGVSDNDGNLLRMSYMDF
jgi:hypothetical protein